MPEKKTILIASVLKPVDDVRHFRKIARSLASANKYQIFIIGKGLTKNSNSPNIQFLPSGQFSRFSLRRLSVQIRLLRAIVKHRPDILLITTPELLFTAWMVKKVFGVRVLYDIQENYQKNFRFQSEYSRSKLLFGTLHRGLSIFQKVVDHHLLAERVYETELGLPPGKYTILENRCLAEDISSRSLKNFSPESPVRLLVSGNHSPYSNTLLAIRFFKRFTETYPNANLIVIGKVVDERYKKAIIQESEQSASIELKLDEIEIPHTKIVEEIHRSDLAIVPYIRNEVNTGKIPTKLFEYACNRIPYFVQQNTSWALAARGLGGGISVDLNDPDMKFIGDTLTKTTALFRREASETPTWDAYQSDLIKLIDDLIEAT